MDGEERKTQRRCNIVSAIVEWQFGDWDKAVASLKRAAEFSEKTRPSNDHFTLGAHRVKVASCEPT